MIVNPVSHICKNVYAKKDHALIGISPFNSYFSETRIGYIYQWASNQFNTVNLYIPDKPTFFTLKALGYQEAKAHKKARRQCAYLKNKISRALLCQGLSEQQIDSCIIDHDALETNLTYQKHYASNIDRYQSDESFRSGCLNSSRWVLSNQLPDGTEPTEEMLLIAVNYFLAELPLFLSASDILQTPSSLFCYHQCPDFLSQIFTERNHADLDERQGFAVINPAETEIYSQVA